MKYGESTFDLLYLLFAVVSGCIMLKKARSKAERRMGRAALTLGLGDAFHLIPRVLNYFVAADLTAALGVGKLVTSLTMTVFYVYMYYIYVDYYGEKNEKRTITTLYVFTTARIVLCLFPQNGWLQNSSDVTWGVLRNLPFVAMGVMIVLLYYRNRSKARRFRFIWLYVALSFLFYIPVATAAGIVPMLGMLMLPKTVCYILILATFYQAVTVDAKRKSV